MANPEWTDPLDWEEGEPEPVPVSAASAASTPNALWLIWAVEGEYSDRSEWPVAVCLDQQTAEAATDRIKELWRTLIALYKAAADDCEDWVDSDPFWLTPEGRELEALTGARGGLGGCYADEREYTCCEVSVLDGAAIARATGAS